MYLIVNNMLKLLLKIVTTFEKKQLWEVAVRGSSKKGLKYFISNIISSSLLRITLCLNKTIFFRLAQSYF